MAIDYHPMDKQILRMCKINLEDKVVKEDYRRFRQIFTWTGQVGQLPLPVLYELIFLHGDFTVPGEEDVVLEKPAPQVQVASKVTSGK